MFIYFEYLQDDSKMKVEETVIHYKYKYDQDINKIKKESKEKKNIDKKNYKRSGKPFY